MNISEQQRLCYIRFFRELDIAIRAAGGTGMEIFTEAELEKMARTFAHNDIHIVYKPQPVVDVDVDTLLIESIAKGE